MNLNQLVNENKSSLNYNDEYILSFIHKNMEKSINLTVSKLAKLLNVSDSTIVRLSKKLGFNGYGEFRYFLKKEYELQSLTTVINNNFMPEILLEDVRGTISIFESKKNLDNLYGQIIYANKIFAYGTGYGQQLMLDEFIRCMWNIGIYIIKVPERRELELLAQDMNEQDIVLIVSLSGKTEKIDEILNTIKLRETKLISVTRFSQNKLSSFSDFSLYYQVTHYNKTKDLNDSSFCTLNLVLSLLYEGLVNFKSKKVTKVIGSSK